MAKRPWSSKEHAEAYPVKRPRYSSTDRLSALSDELVLRTLSFLPVSTLVACHRLSHRFCTLSSDPQLWKSAYYNRFVRPRASRIPGIRDQGAPAASLFYSSRISKWLKDDHLVKEGNETNWKKQYKLRHNWSKGSCDVSEIQISARPSLPPMLVRLYEDIVFTADKLHGLRAWIMKGSQRLLASLGLNPDGGQEGLWDAPTSLAIDTSSSNAPLLRISVGFSDGRFGTYALNKEDGSLTCQYMHAASSNGAVSAVAYAAPYLVTMTDAQLLSLYSFPSQSPDSVSIKDPPRLLASLKSHTAWPPLTLSIRASSSSIIISIAYALPTYLSGWSVGLQELRISTEGTVIHSRLTSATNQGFTPLFASSSGFTTPTSEVDDTLPRSAQRGSIPSLTKPTSLSYSHPYLLASHPDNTLTLYLVQSNDIDLIIANGSRLWGHTSSVSGAHVGDRGKAVSVSAHGGEIRVWELEGGINSISSKKRAAAGQASIQIRPEPKKLEQDSSASGVSVDESGRQRFRSGQAVDELSTTKGWVGFDEEKVVVLREKGQGTQALVVYDFS
ncbi:hypothetical protein MMC34_007292 [Xylographa carneopallida]|nr:hypothetical protein [Xylographa carneopallida]